MIPANDCFLVLFLFFPDALGEIDLQSFGWEAKNLFRNSPKKKKTGELLLGLIKRYRRMWDGSGVLENPRKSSSESLGAFSAERGRVLCPSQRIVDGLGWKVSA